MSIELQNLDCNCNNCKHLTRSLSKRQKHVDFHYEMQKNLFNIKRIKLLEKGEWRLNRGEKEKAKTCFKDARKMKFVFGEGSCSLFYGQCSKLEKDVSFIPNILQLETQDCYENRTQTLT